MPGPEENTDNEENDIEEGAEGGDEEGEGQEGGDEEGGDENVAAEGEEAAGTEGEEPSGKTGAEASQSRRDKRIAALQRERDEAREKLIRAETLAEERGKPKPAVSPEIAARQREEKLALMTPEEKREFTRDEEIAQLRFQGQLTQLQTADAMDKLAYDGNARVDPLYKKHAAEVEKRLATFRSAGQNPPRETILNLVVGESMRKEAERKKGGSNPKREEARSRTNGATGKSVSGRSDASSSKRGSGPESLEQLEKRLENTVF